MNEWIQQQQRRKGGSYNFINCGGRCEKQNSLFDRSRNIYIIKQK
jgi:hypothetical protein